MRSRSGSASRSASKACRRRYSSIRPQQFGAISREEVRRPSTAHMLATGFVVLDVAPVVQNLRSEAKEWLQRPLELPATQLTLARYAGGRRLRQCAGPAQARYGRSSTHSAMAQSTICLTTPFWLRGDTLAAHKGVSGRTGQTGCGTGRVGATATIWRMMWPSGLCWPGRLRRTPSVRQGSLNGNRRLSR